LWTDTHRVRHLVAISSVCVYLYGGLNGVVFLITCFDNRVCSGILDREHPLFDGNSLTLGQPFQAVKTQTVQSDPSGCDDSSLKEMDDPRPKKDCQFTIRYPGRRESKFQCASSTVLGNTRETTSRHLHRLDLRYGHFYFSASCIRYKGEWNGMSKHIQRRTPVQKSGATKGDDMSSDLHRYHVSHMSQIM
jgi:hypothetical protein